MAKKSDLSLTRSAIKALWSQIGTNTWQDLLKQHKPGHGFIRAGNDKLKGLCLDPKHHDTSPSFYIDVERGFAKCYGSSCGCYVSDPVQLISMITGQTLSETLKYVVRTFKPPQLSEKSVNKFEASRRHQEMKQHIMLASQKLTQMAILEGLDSPRYAWAADSLRWISERRQIPLDILNYLPVAILPPFELLESFLVTMYAGIKEEWLDTPVVNRGEEPVDHSNNAIKYLADTYRAQYQGAIMFPQYATLTEISRFKLRFPDANPGDPKRIYVVDDEHDDGLGLFGLNWGPYTDLLGKYSDVREVIVTEGEFDVLSLMAKCITENVEPTIPVISAGGNGSAKDIEPVLENLGVTQAYFVGDAPDKAGNDVIQTWLRNIKKLPVRIFTGWDHLAPAKDLDDAAVMESVGLQKTLASITPRNADNYSAIWHWLADTLAPKIDALRDDDTRGKVDSIAEALTMVNNAIERRQFIEVMSSKYGISANLIQREATTRNDTPASFVYRLADAISDIMLPFATRTEGNSRQLMFYNLERRTFHSVTLDSTRSIVQELAPVTGALHTFIEEHVGWPPFLERVEDADMVTYKLTMDTVKELLKDAVLHLTKGVNDLNMDRKYRQGYHRITRVDGELVEVYICGTEVIHIHREGQEVRYETLPGPVYKDIIFDVGLSNSLDSKPWFPGGITADMMALQGRSDLKKAYHMLKDMFSIGFTFRDHDVTCQLLPGLMMTFPIMNTFVRPTMVYISGDTNSGKSKLCAMFSPVAYSDLRILHNSQGSDGFTAAAIARNIDGDSRMLHLDEFENSGNDETKRQQVQTLFTLFRGLVSGQATREVCITTGQNTSGVTRQHVSMPLILSGIHGAELVQDMNRSINIFTQQVRFKDDPYLTIKQQYSEAQIDELRYIVNLGMVAYAQELHEIEKDIRRNFGALCKELKVQAEERWAGGLTPTLALMQFIGEDYKQFFKDYIETQRYSLKRVEANTESWTTLSGIMHNACIKQVEGPNISLAQLMVIPERRAEINSANKGVFYDPSTQQLLFLAPAIYTMLPSHLRRTVTTSHQVRTVLERHPDALKPEEIEASGILKRIGPKMGANISLNDVIVLDAASWLHTTRDQEVLTEGSKESAHGLEEQVVRSNNNPAGTAARPVASLGNTAASTITSVWGEEEEKE
jgi:hypothetical protein